MADKLEVKITADNTDLKNKLNSSTQLVKKAAKGLMIAGAAALAAGAAIAIMADKTAKAGDNFQKMAIRTGISVENLSRLDFAAQRSGSNITTVESAIRYMTKSMSDSTQGLATAARGFDMLGVSVTDERGNLRNSIDVMKDVSAGLSGMTNKTQQIVAAQYIFGSRFGTQLLPMLTAGTSGLKDLFDASDALGNTWSTKDAEAAAKFADRLTDMKSAMDGLRRSLMVRTFPFFQGAMLGAVGVVQSLNDIQGAMVKTGEVEATLAGDTLDAFEAIAQGMNNMKFSFNEAFAHIKSGWYQSGIGAFWAAIEAKAAPGGKNLRFSEELEKNLKEADEKIAEARKEIDQGWIDWAGKSGQIEDIFADLKTQLANTDALATYHKALADLEAETDATTDATNELQVALQGFKTLNIQGITGNRLMTYIGNLNPIQQEIQHVVTVQIKWDGQKIQIDPNSLNNPELERKIGRSVIQQILSGRNLAFGGG